MIMTATTSVASDIRSLSSGTVSTLICNEWFREMRDWYRSNYYSRRRSLQLNPLQSQDGWIIDRVQFAWARFAELNPEHDNWHLAWDAWIDEIAKRVHFKCSYMGGVDYEVVGFGRSVETKLCVSEYEASIYNGVRSEFERRVVPTLGCAWAGVGDYPPESVSVLFPLHTPLYFDRNNDFLPTLHPDWPQPRQGTTVSGMRCSWQADARFDPTLDQWEQWREVATK